MRRFPRLISLLWRWHRRTGVLLFFFVLLLCVTGILLNHSSELGLDAQFVEGNWAGHFYSDQVSQLRAYPLGDEWLSRALDGRVYLDAQEVGSCRGELVGAMRTPEMLLAACAEEMLLLTHAGELIEAIDGIAGLPVPLTALAQAGDRVAIGTDGRWMTADLQALRFDQSIPPGENLRQIAPGELPDRIRNAIPAPQRWLTWERLLLDLHSGRLPGRWGVWVMDAVAVLLACVASSGLTMWWLHRGRRRVQRRMNT